MSGRDTMPDTDTACCAPIREIESVDGTAEEAALFKALGDPTRLGILKLLSAQDEPVCVCDITSRFPLNQPTISHRLRLLREAGLVSASRRGTWAYYSPRRERIEGAVRTLRELAGESVPV